MLSFRVGSASTNAVASDLAQYYAGEQTMAEYYGHAGELRPDLSAAMTARLGLAQGESAVTKEQTANLMLGRRADGGEIAGKTKRKFQVADRERVAFVDFTFSAPKSFSVAVALAPDAEERAKLIGAHQSAVQSAMGYLESQIAHVRRGNGGRLGTEAAELAWVGFDHFTARPTPGAVPDPQTHTHVIVPNVALTASGHAGSLNLNLLKHRIHEAGGVYQAYLARELRQAGASVRLGVQGDADLSVVPRHVVTAFSRRTDQAEAHARQIAKRDGMDWSALSSEQQVARVKAAARATRQAKQKGEPAEAEWRQRAEGLGYRHRSVLGKPPTPTAAPTAAQRLDLAYETAAPMLGREFQRNATLPVGKVRELAVRGLVAAGISDQPANDIDAVVHRFTTRGIRQDSTDTRVIIRGQSATTALSYDQEAEAIGLAKDAAAHQRPATDLQDARAAFLATHPAIDSMGDQWRHQMMMADRLASGAGLELGVGAAGAGKSTVLGVLVPAWHAEGRQVYGATLAWRQADDLAEAGIGEDRRMALARFLRQADRGELALSHNAVVVVDEIGLIGTRQTLELLRLQQRHGFRIVGIGDPLQCQAVEAGSGIELLRRALGDDMIPEITTSIRQRSQRDRETAALWREGRAWEALSRLDADGGLHLTEGREATIAKAAELAISGAAGRRGHSSTAETQAAPSVSPPLFITASNADARDLGLAIRERRQAAAGELGPEAVTVRAVDRAGQFAMPIATGDRVRFFDRVQDMHAGKRRVVAVNGDVCAVLAADQAGLVVKNERTGVQGRVQFDRIRDKETGAIKITSGEATTIHTSQGATVDSAVFVLPSGSAGLDAFRAYTAASRHRQRIQLVLNAEADRAALRAARPLGDCKEIGTADVIGFAADNLGRQQNREMAIAMMERVTQAEAQQRQPTQADRDAARSRVTAQPDSHPSVRYASESQRQSVRARMR